MEYLLFEEVDNISYNYEINFYRSDAINKYIKDNDLEEGNQQILDNYKHLDLKFVRFYKYGYKTIFEGGNDRDGYFYTGDRRIYIIEE